MFDRMIEKRNEGGFTLIELLIVIIILAILAAIVVFAVGTTGQNAKNAACSADSKTFETALEAYKAEDGTTALPYGTASPNQGSQLVSGGFLRELPTTTHYQIWTDGAGGVYVLPTSAVAATVSAMTTAAFDSTYTANNFDVTNGSVCSTVPS
jgi:prepilin-type N-terminal cleavage/methylation domain-containing protein